jgi:hypothetical protein
MTSVEQRKSSVYGLGFMFLELISAGFFPQKLWYQKYLKKSTCREEQEINGYELSTDSPGHPEEESNTANSWSSIISWWAASFS